MKTKAMHAAGKAPGILFGIFTATYLIAACGFAAYAAFRGVELFCTLFDPYPFEAKDALFFLAAASLAVVGACAGIGAILACAFLCCSGISAAWGKLYGLKEKRKAGGGGSDTQEKDAC